MQTGPRIPTQRGSGFHRLAAPRSPRPAAVSPGGPTTDPELWSLGSGSMTMRVNVVPILLFIPDSGVIPPAATPIWMTQQVRMSLYLDISSELASGALDLWNYQATNMMTSEQSPNAPDLQTEEHMIDDLMSFEESVYRYMHRNRSLDVDTMSYEELLELEEQIGKANAGLSEDTVQKNLKRMKYPSSAAYKAESCCICQEDYADGEELGVLTCGHDFHASCVGKWLVQKNFCPICKKTALST